MTGRLDAAVAELVAALREEMASAAVPGPERLYSIPEACELMGGIGRTALYSELMTGRIRSVKVGRRRLIPASAIAERAS